jgi:hypothetical protein
VEVLAGPVNHIFGNPKPSINTIGGNGLPYIDTPVDGLGRSPYSNTTATYGFNGEFLPLISEMLFNHSLRDPHRENVLGHHLQSSVTNQLPYARSSPDRYNSGTGSYQPELSFSTSTALMQSPFSPATPPVQHHTNQMRAMEQWEVERSEKNGWRARSGIQGDGMVETAPKAKEREDGGNESEGGDGGGNKQGKVQLRGPVQDSFSSTVKRSAGVLKVPFPSL